MDNKKSVPINSEKDFITAVEKSIQIATNNRERELEKSPDRLADELILACQEGNITKVESLLKSGASPNMVRTVGTAFTLAMCSRSPVDIASLLIINSADPNLQDQNGWFPLFCAAGNNREDAIHFLVEAGADINAQCSSNGWTALMNAAYFGHTECLKALLEHGADPGLKSVDGIKAIDLVRRRSTTD